MRDDKHMMRRRIRTVRNFTDLATKFCQSRMEIGNSGMIGCSLYLEYISSSCVFQRHHVKIFFMQLINMYIFITTHIFHQFHQYNINTFFSCSPRSYGNLFQALQEPRKTYTGSSAHEHKSSPPCPQ